MSIELRSQGFLPGSRIPKLYTEGGKDVSPPLHWNDAPEETKEYALVCDDPDAPSAEPWVYWVLYNIPANVHELPEGLPDAAELESPSGARQGRNSWKSGQTVGYRGPAPPKGHGLHHYHFRLYALDAALKFDGKTPDRDALLKAMKGHILAEGELIGTYQR
ncbi:MAG TPA: YbhB/YbcL family Raf kinase inhibitor-like protein [Pirellulales bacterium]|nr:YbhB/YbcL family Raf kinase inhibitor-like protein [Pirellulales bacterium]